MVYMCELFASILFVCDHFFTLQLRATGDPLWW